MSRKKQHNQSPLDEPGVFAHVVSLIESGEFNTSISKILTDELGYYVSEAAIRRFRKRHQIASPSMSYARIEGDLAKASTPPISRSTPIDQPILDDPDKMLRDRGLDPSEWHIETITVNEWDGPGKDTDIVQYYQAKFTARKNRPELRLMPVRSDGWKPTKSIPMVNTNHELVVICGDQQAPFHDLVLHHAFCDWLAINRPDRGVLLGDLMDFPDVSRHPDDPDNVASVNECLQSGYDILRDYVYASPDTSWDFLMGNHDQRIKTYVINHAAPINNIARVQTAAADQEYVLTLEHLMRLDELGVHMVLTNGTYEDAQVTLSPHLAVRHGWIVRTGSGSTALKTLEKTGYSIVVGHVHRQSLVYHTTHDIDRTPTTLVAAEAGCMCRMDGRMDDSGRRFPSYQVLPDWQQGMCVARIFKDGTHHLSLGTYVNDVLLWEDQQIKGY